MTGVNYSAKSSLKIVRIHFLGLIILIRNDLEDNKKL